ncbi:peptidoglycan-binding protein LysM [Leuconostoc palmae]|uniref:peptidoglycan-binding protein LysM n=1 Tax=Leuconostoc palmae TaxID=501487 RepID=UPI001C7D7B94|nr:peptidoglycan-binding protein LysM [Leuconostoc palmae]
MNDFDPNNMSRLSRSNKQKIEPNFERQSDKKGNKHKGLKIALIILGFLILSSVPVLGMITHQKSSNGVKTAATSSEETSSKSDANSSSSKVESSSSSSSAESESLPQSSSSSTNATSQDTNQVPSQVPSQSSSAVESVPSTPSVANTTAVLGASQTLYNFATTHGMTTDQVIALNPGLSVANYSQFAGRSLNVK